MRRSKKIALLTCFVTAIGVTAANAHVEFNPDSVKANVNQVLVLDVPHDCTAATKTTLIKFQLPISIDAATFKAIGVFQHGKALSTWHEKLTRAGGRNYIAVSGPAITTGPDGGKNAADIKFKLTPMAQRDLNSNSLLCSTAPMGFRQIGFNHALQMGQIQQNLLLLFLSLT